MDNPGNRGISPEEETRAMLAAALTQASLLIEHAEKIAQRGWKFGDVPVTLAFKNMVATMAVVNLAVESFIDECEDDEGRYEEQY